MTKERIKSIILVLLVISNLVLAERILVNEKLWLRGYNFFNIGNNQRKNDHTLFSQLSLPEKIFLNTGYQSTRYEYLRANSEFANIFAVSKEVLKKGFSMPLKAVSQISAESWYSALTTKSLYLYYPAKYSGEIFAGLLELSDTEMNFKAFSDIVIAENGNIYIADEGTYYRIDCADSSIGSIIEEISESEHMDVPIINYSFDLNFDKNTQEQQTIISHMIPIYSEPLSANKIISRDPIFRDGTVNNRVVSGILTAFSINPNTVRRYTEADGTLVFVENNGILKISSAGVLSYTATGRGISLTGGVSGDAISQIADFIDTLGIALDSKADLTLISQTAADNTSLFSFDYLVNGIRIKFNQQNAIDAEISGGNLVSYTQILRIYDSYPELISSPLYIESLDEIIARYQNSMPEIRITKMYPAYLDDIETGEKALDWHIEIDNVIVE